MQNLFLERPGMMLNEEDPQTGKGDGDKKCDHFKTEPVPAKEPTCTEDGWHDYVKCLDCGAELGKTRREAIGHDWKEATCTEPQVCQRSGCNATKGSPIPHDWEGKVECSKCGLPNPYIPSEPKPTSPPGNDPTSEPTADANPEEISDLPGGPLPENPDADNLNGDAEESEAITLATEEPAPVPDDGFCNIFDCGCWIFILLALVIGVLSGWFLNEVLRRKKQKKRRSRPYTELDYNTVAPTMAQPAVASAPMAAPMSAAMPATAMPVGTGIGAAVHQHIGARKDQQDSYGVSDLNAYSMNGFLAVVADGMGGLANGKAVSSALVQSMVNYFRQTTGNEDTADMMLDMVTQANDQINRMLQGAERSGSTLVSTVIRNGRLHFLTVGDSRLYLYRNGVLLQLNREHIYQEELALKSINHIVPLAQVTGDRQAHALTSYLGIGRLTYIDRNYESIKLQPGDRLLLASDGVFGTLSEQEMEAALRNPIGDATKMIGQMILKANMPYQDNNTALVLEYRG